MIKAIIIDDEADGRDVLTMLLAELCNDISIVATCENGKEGVQQILKHQPDLVFLDISMPGMSGFDVLDCVKNLPLKVIFVTAHNEHAVTAFKYSAVDYLLKPVSSQTLLEAVDKARNMHFTNNNSSQYEMLNNQLKENNRLPEIIALPMSDGLQVVEVKNIMYCKADRNYTNVYIHPKQKMLVTKQLKEFEEILTPHGFFRAHNSSLINLRFVEKYVRGDGGYIVMKDENIIEIARQRKDEFMKLIQKI